MMGVYTGYILPMVRPDLSLIWFRNPDSTEHTFGLGCAAVGALTGAADGSGAVGAVETLGYSVSGDIRSADLLTRAGIPHVYDGVGCTLDPVMSGIKSDGTQLYPTQVDDANGTVCGVANAKFTTGSFKVPATVPTDAVIIAANGGSDYFYLPSHDSTIVKAVVLALQVRKGYGAIFVRDAYGAIPGTMSLKDIKVEGSTRPSPPTPDIVVSFDYAETAATSGLAPGTEYESAQGNRGMHGSFSPIDVHNVLVAAGPDFKAGFNDAYPTGNVDVAPTVARILGLPLPQADGRPLKEAMTGQNVTYTVTSSVVPSTTATLAGACNPDDIACATLTSETSYSFSLFKKTLTLDDNTTTYTYFDKAKAVRQ
jgi:hypothetical protein